MEHGESLARFIQQMFRTIRRVFMRLLNNDSNKKMDDITILLTHEEICELRDAINEILESEQTGYHSHINDATYTKEITIAIYNDENVKYFNERCQTLIMEDV